MSNPTLTQGAYGFRLAGLVSSALVDAVPESWPLINVERRPIDEHTPKCSQAGDSVVEIVFPNHSALRIDRRRSTITFFVPPGMNADELVHPYLSPAAALFAGWFGHAVFHSGAFVCDGGAWGLLGARSAGKSTTLAYLAQMDVPVLADDILVFDGEHALAGPRCIDLRPDAAVRFSERSNEVRGGDRRRLLLPPINAEVPVRGFFFFGWGESLAVSLLRPSERLALLNRSCLPEAANPTALLELARLPAWRLTRPLGFETLGDVCGKLLDTAQG